MPRASGLVLIALLAATACTCDEEAPAPAPDRPAAEPEPAAEREPAAAGPSEHGGPDSATRMPLEPGQWVRYRISPPDGDDTTFTFRVVGEEDGDHWVEVDVQDPGEAEKLFRLRIDFGDRPGEEVQIKEAYARIDGRTTHMTGPDLQDSIDPFRLWLSMSSAPILSDTQEDVTVPAGTFRQAFVRTERSFAAGVAGESRSWRHPAVPIFALVKAETSEGSTVTLLAMGTGGAESRF